MDASQKEKILKKEQKKRQKQKDKIAKYSSPKGVRKRRAKRCVILAIVIIIIAAIVTGIVMCSNGFMHRHITAFTVDGEDFTVADYNYWFQTISDQMVSTTYSYADRQTTIQNATSIISVAKAAEKMGVELSEDELQSLVSTREKLAAEAEEYSGGKIAFYNSTYGFATNEDIVMKNYRYQVLAIKYYNDFVEKLDYTDADLENYYTSEAHEFLDKASFRYAILTTDENGTLGIAYGSAQEASEAAKRIDSKLTDENSFENAIKEELERNGQDAENFDYTMTLQEDSLATSFSTDISEIKDWIFSSDRKANDHKTFDVTFNGTKISYVIFITSPPQPEDYKTVDMRHILISTTDDDSDLSEDELKNNAEAKIKEIEEEWNSTDKTEDDFAALAKKYSADSTAENGGLIEQIYKGQLVESMDEWLFESERQPGDYTIVESTYGYHLVYFSGFNTEKWKIDAEQYLIEKDFEAETKRIISENGITSSSNNFLISVFADENAEG